MERMELSVLCMHLNLNLMAWYHVTCVKHD